MAKRRLHEGHWPKFVGIACGATGAQLFALDENGRVWVYNWSMGQWARLSAKRQNELDSNLTHGKEVTP